MPLTEDARNEIREAIRIVREDRFEAYVRSRVPAPPKEDPKDELIEKDGPPNPPPPKDEPPKDEPPKRKSSYWGEILD